jgi:Autotransporter beta-domain
LDAGAAWSDIFANDTAGTANGNFTGTRWLVSGGLIGTYPWQMLVLEPSARVFAIWEHENAFTDSLGTFQPARNFETGRASAGVKSDLSVRLDVEHGRAVALCRPLRRLLFLKG